MAKAPQDQDQDQQQQTDGSQPADGGDIGGGADNAMEQIGGLSAEDQALFDQMAQADGAPGVDAAAGAQGADGGAAADDKPAKAGAQGGADDGAGAAADDDSKAGAAADADAGGDGDDDGDDDGQQAQDGQPDPDEVKFKQNPGARVALGRFLKQKRAVKAAETALAESNRKLTETATSQARLDERLRILNEALTGGGQQPGQQQQQQEEEAQPDPDADAFGWMKWAANKIARLEGGQQQMTEERQADSTEAAIREAYTRDAVQARDALPGFAGPDGAYAYLMQARSVQLSATMFGKNLLDGDKLTEAEIGRLRNAVGAEERQLAATELRNKRSPAKQIMTLARSMGWQPPKREQQQQDGGQQQNGQQQNGNGQQKPGAAAKPGNGQQQNKGSVSDEIERIQRGQDASESLSNGGGGARAPITMESLARMSDNDFESMLDGTDEDAFKRLMGGAA